jgi:lysophospholipase L1-like esterase
VCEVACRIYFARHLDYHVEMSRYTALVKQPSPNPEIGHVHRPDTTARLMGVEVGINADGFRDREYAGKPPGVRRIVFLGDSLTFGWGVRKESTFEHLLEEKLNAGRPVEIVNFGTGNYNTMQEVALFLDRGADFEPDQVDLFYFINDAETASGPSSFGFLAHSRFLTFVWSRLRPWLRSSSRRNYRDYYASLYRPGSEGWRAAREALGRLRDRCRRDGIVLQVVLLPELHQLDPYPFRSEHARIRAFLEEEGIACLDATPALDPSVRPREYWVAADDAHPNARAHRRIADYVFPFVSEGLLR